MNYYRPLLFVLIVPYSNLFAQTYDGFSNKEIQSVFKQWNLDNLDNLDDGGEISRYIFLKYSCLDNSVGIPF